MGRSVSTPSEAVYVSYAALALEQFGDDFQWEWKDACDDFQAQMLRAVPSLISRDAWIGREDHVLAGNRFCNIGVSEYCGLVAMWLVPVETAPYHYGYSLDGLRDRWIDRIEVRFRAVASSCFGQALVRQGTFSNGAAIFCPPDGRQQGALGLGYASGEGWL